MLSNSLKSLYSFITSVPEVSSSTGMSLGGQIPDPTVQDGPFPSAWLIYAGQTPLEKPKNGVVAKGTPVKDLFVVMLYLDNTLGQDNLIDVQLPIAGKIVVEVAGKEVLNEAASYRFNYEGTRLASVSPKRLSYEMRFSIATHL